VRYGIDEYTGQGHSAHYVADTSEPRSILEAQNSSHSKQWLQAAEDEFRAHKENGTWKLVKLPPGRKTIGCKWVFKAKSNSEGNIERYKARLGAKGYSQTYSIDYNETFAPVVQRSSLRALLSYAVNRGMHIHQMDVCTAFLNGDVSEEIYMDQP
jgi:hypothetical protein